MKQMTLKAIAGACGGTFYGEDSLPEREISSVVIDSRKAQAGCLYIPIRGKRVDGHTFIPDVFGKGAAAVLSEEALENPPGPYILVKSCLRALRDIAEFYRSTLEIPVVGITGSVGKTCTKEMVAAVLSQKYRVLKTEGNFNNQIGLPLTLLSVRPEHEVAVVEMGISEFGEMHRLAKMARPNVCVITNISDCHLENLGDRDGVLKAKSEMFDFLKEDSVIILNGTDDKLSEIRSVKGIRPVRYFVADQREPLGRGAYFVTADSIESHGLRGMTAVFHFQHADCTLSMPIPGVHNIYNACAAACVGDALGLSLADICVGIVTAKTIAGRTNLVEAGDITILDDTYNANPASVRASLDVLSKAPGRKVAVLGDMKELGKEKRELHCKVGAYVAGIGIDLLLTTGDLAAKLQKEAAAGCDARHYDTLDELREALPALIQKGDTVLVKASHSMRFSEIVTALKDL